MWIDEFDRLLFKTINSVEATIQAAILKKKYMPEIVYKYRRVSKRNLEALSNNFLIAAAPSTLNDPNEGALYIDFKNRWKMNYEYFLKLFEKETGLRLAIDLSKIQNRETLILELAFCMDIRPDEFHSWKEMWDKTDSELQGVLEEMQKGIRVNNDELHRICSLSSVCDSDPMWLHYAEDYSGYCVGYNIRDLDNDLTDLLFPVRYVNSKLEVDNTFFGGGKSNDSFLIDSLTRKSVHWSYENEWRLLILSDGSGNYQKVELQKPKIIILGKNITAENQEVILQIADYLETPCFKQTPKENAYGYELVNLNL